MLTVQRRQCSTCIYHPGSPLDLATLETAIADPHLPGFFTTYRVCHHADTACCAGFWARHKDAFTLGQLAQRLDCIAYVDVDIY